MDSESTSGLKYPGKTVVEWFHSYLVGWFIQMEALNLRHLMEVNEMKMMDCVEVAIEKETYARDGVHKGMQGWICLEQRTEGYWLVGIFFIAESRSKFGTQK